MGRTVAAALVVVVDGLRLLVRHWPVLVVLFLLGAAVRELVLWGSFVLSREHPVAASVTVTLAPLATLTALILMLRALLPSLRHVEGRPETMSQRMQVVSGALIPFLALYAAQGYLRDDMRRFVNETFSEEFRQTTFLTGSQMADRTIGTVDTPVLVATVVAALVLRWLVDRLDLPRRHAVFGFLAAWLEVVWLAFAAKSIATQWSGLWGWVLDRRAVDGVVGVWERLTGALGPVGGAVSSLTSWVWGVLGDFDVLVVVPLAWLVVGAVVYGSTLGDPVEPPEVPLPERVARRVRTLEELVAAARVRQRLSLLPDWLRDWLAQPIASFTSRFTSLGTGLRTLVRAGLVPMVTLCLVFLLARQSQLLVAWGLRAVLPSMEAELMVALAPYVDILFSGVSWVLVAVLVAAAVDRFLVLGATEKGVPEPATAGGALP
ncbi:hypothetical protein DV701_13510 [Ornithinimicrobium avium]|uniref:Uncharacterized protein n=1 Tax=Ornithinimicrobium avium TaxID=2283195 RepID=A0A345NPP1_9MICO|nr:hypothetical protein DV701_13510 [Ornithinimicrobium avium]